MDSQGIFNMARLVAGNVSPTDPRFTDAALLPFAQIARHEIENSIITRVDEDYFYKIFKVNTVANQNEYSFQSTNWIQLGMKKILSVGIKYKTTDVYYKSIDPCPTNNFTKYIDELRKTNPAWLSFYTLKNSSLYIYPEPTEIVSNWLMVEAIVTLPDLTITSTDDEIFPNSELRDYHYIIALWIAPYIHKILKQANDAQYADNEYRKSIEKMVSEVWERYNSVTESCLPNWNEWK